MATWNRLKTLRQARTDALNAVEPPAPPEFTDIGNPPLIEVNGATTDFTFDIPGTLPQRVDIFEYVPEEEPIERWPARVRGVTFPVRFVGIDASGLDSELVTVNGLTASVIFPDTWVGYFPGLSSGTQVGEKGAQQFSVGLPVSFTITGPTLYGTAYLPNAEVYGVDNSSAGTQWNGTVNSVNYTSNTLTVVPAYISRTILISDPTQKWSMYNTAAEAASGEVVPE